jgi:phage terminase Nu1 subunit (DNA packaging protein)
VSYTDKDVLKILNIQAKTLKRIDSMLRDALEEVANQKQFIVRLYREMKEDIPEEQENVDISDDEPLPTNVLVFPSDKT